MEDRRNLYLEPISDSHTPALHRRTVSESYVCNGAPDGGWRDEKDGERQNPRSLQVFLDKRRHGKVGKGALPLGENYSTSLD